MPGRPLTILQLTHQGGPAGSTQSIFNLSEHLARRGHRVLVGCRDDVLLARLARAARLDVVSFDFTRLGSLARALQGAIAQHGVAVVNSHGTRDRRALTWLRWRGRLSQAFVVTRRTMPLTSSVELLAVGLTADRTIAVSAAVAGALRRRDRKSTRLNSSHANISYAVFCLKKKKNNDAILLRQNLQPRRFSLFHFSPEAVRFSD